MSSAVQSSMAAETSAASQRRLLYKRSHTVAAVPTAVFPDTAQGQHHRRGLPLLPLGDSPSLTRKSSSLEKDIDSEVDADDASEIDAPVSPGGILVLNGSRNNSTKLKRTRFQSAVSTIEPAITVEREDNRRKRSNSGGSTGHGQTSKNSGAGTKGQGVPKQGSTNLINRVKERIRDRVMAASEWPNAAAMMHERRQRANDALQASFNASRDLALMQQISLHELHRKTRGKTDSGVKYEMAVAESSVKGEAVRQAFIRRRSISEDTYDRTPCLNLNKTDELGPLTQEHKTIASRLFKRSPRPHRKPMRAQSLDSAKMNRVNPDSNTTQASIESSTSTLSSIRTMDSVGSTSNVGSRGDVFEPAITVVKKPEIVLDSRSKERLVVQDDEVEVDIEELDPDMPSTSTGRRMSKPVPEVVFDEHGQTWDVYGAEFDPEIVGQAIQKHVERLMFSTIERERRLSQIATCQQEANSESEERTTVKSADRGFWLRLLCLFTGREVRS